MTGFGAALATEILKARRGRALWFAGLGYMLLPLVGGLFMIILKDPAATRNMGLISAKAQLAAGVADWPAFFGMLSQGTAIGGTVVYALGTSWVFGREYADHTLKDLLALPTPRSALVAAKLLVLLAWGLALAAAACLVGIAVGSAIGLPGWSPAAVTQAVANLAVTAVLTLSLVTPIALAASIGRGYLPPWLRTAPGVPGPDQRGPRLGRLLPVGRACPLQRDGRAFQHAAGCAQLPAGGPYVHPRRRRHVGLVGERRSGRVKRVAGRKAPRVLFGAQ